MKTADTQSWEVRCPRCRVSFPLGTRRCMHCGGATVSPQVDEAFRRGPELPMGNETEADSDEEAVVVARRGVGRGAAVLWLAVAVAVSIYRSCTGAP
jgi:hypothetical protein